MEPLINVQQKSYQDAKVCYICQEKFEDKNAKNKKYCNHCLYTREYRGAA